MAQPAVASSSRWDGIRLARWCIYAVAVAAPLATTALPGVFPLTHDVVELPKQALVRLLAFGALALFLGVLALRGATFREHRGWWLLAAFAAWTLVATAFSAGPATSVIGRDGRLDGLVTTVTYCALAFVAGQLLSDAGSLRAFVRAAVAASVVVSAYAVLQNLGFEPLNYLQSTAVFGAGRAFATLGNPVFLGGYLTVTLPLALALAVSDRSVAWRWSGVAGLAVGIPAVLATFTRGSWIAVAFEIVLLAVVLARRRVLGALAVWVGAAAGAVWAIVLGVLSLSSASRFSNVAARAQVVAGDSIAERLLIWRGMLGATAARPALGWGPDMAELAFEAHRPAAHAQLFASSVVDNAHDWPLQLSVTVGVPGALLALGTWGWALAGTARDAFSRDGARSRWLVTGAWIALAGYGVHLLSAVAETGSQALAWVLVGALLGVRATAREVGPLRAGRALVAVLAVAWVALAVWTGMLLLADHDFLLHRAQLRGQLAGDPSVTAAAASALSPLSATYVVGEGDAAASDSASKAGSGDATAARELATRAARFYASAAVLDPGDWAALLAEAEQWRAAGRTDLADAALRRALADFPRNPYVFSAAHTAGLVDK